MRRSPRSSSHERDKRWTGDLGSLALVSSAVRLEWIIGSTRTAEGAIALDAKSHSPSLILLCCRITRPPTLHSRAWRTSNFAPQPSQCDGRSPGVLAWWSKSASLNSFAESSVPLSAEGMTLSHCPVSVPHRIVLGVSQSKSARIEDRVESSFSVRRDLSSVVTAFRTDLWSAELKDSVPLKAGP